MWESLLDILVSGFSVGSRVQRAFVGLPMALAGAFFLLLSGWLATGEIESALPRGIVMGISALVMALSALSFWFVFYAISGDSERDVR